MNRILACVAPIVLALGCSNPAAPTPLQPGDEEQVRQTFAAFQAGLKARDAQKVWAVIDSDSQADAERAAEAVRTAYGKADAAGKAEQEKALGLGGAELASLNGQGFLKTRRFHGKYDEVPDSKVESVAIQGDKATVNYVEADGDKEKFTLVREGGKWKLTVPMPKAAQP